MSLEVKDLYVGYYRDIAILQGVSLAAQEGKITTLIGPNGVGKSTLLKTIYGFLTPFRGSIITRGEEITGIAPHLLVYKGISYIPQRRNVFPYLTVEENLVLGAWTFRQDRTRIGQVLEENYARFPDLREKRRQKAGTLSGGQQRMVELGRALMVSPTTLLVDEPTAGLAPKVASEIYYKLRALNEEEGKTILLVDQNIRQALRISDYVYVFELGKNKEEGPRERFETDLRELIKDWLF